MQRSALSIHAPAPVRRRGDSQSAHRGLARSLMAMSAFQLRCALIPSERRIPTCRHCTAGFNIRGDRRVRYKLILRLAASLSRTDIQLPAVTRQRIRGRFCARCTASSAGRAPPRLLASANTGLNMSNISDIRTKYLSLLQH